MHASLRLKFSRGVMILICLITCTSGSAQSLENIRASFQNGKVIVLYDLVSISAEERYSMQLFGSHDNYGAPLASVEGDVGDSIAGGNEKTIIWDAARDLGKFNGEITFKIRGKAMALPFSFISPAEGSKVRRGKNVRVTWQGGRKGQTVRMELYRGGQLVREVAETENSGAYSWRLPGDLKKGAYSLRLLTGPDVVASQPFMVRRRIPMALKILPIIAIGGAAVVVLGGEAGGGTPDTPRNSDLPAPPGPD